MTAFLDATATYLTDATTFFPNSSFKEETFKLWTVLHEQAPPAHVTERL